MDTLIVNLYAGPGAGKCFGKGTKVLMWNGTVKNIEDIKVGDIVMGDDSTPRNVLKLHHGNTELYKLHRSHSKDIIVSANHILSLLCYHANKTWTYEDISIEDYFNKSKKYKHYSRLYKTKINYSTQKSNLKIDPYYLGYWLGDGLSDQLNRFCTADSEVIDYCRNYAEKLGLKLKQHSYKEGCCQTYCLSEGNNGNHSNHPLKENLYNLIKNKHIPLEYKTASINDRLNLIAGLIDSDGGVSNSCFDWINKNYQLAYDFYCLVNSCGLRATIKKCNKQCKEFIGTYYRVSISGDLTVIPTKIKRKQEYKIVNDSTKALRECFTIESIGKGEYFGFTTDRNHRFVLDDCTVVHNSTAAAYIFAKLKMAGVDCEYVPEYAKDRTWQGDHFPLEKCQLYVTGKQALRIARLVGKVRVIITDSPIALGSLYTDEQPYKDISIYEGCKYKDQLNIFLNRGPHYNPNGRNQTEEEAISIDNQIKKMLSDNGISYSELEADISSYDEIVDSILALIG